MGLAPYAVEKDWWVVQSLALIFQMDIGSYLVFKGGTSLSKAWKIIERFSEDIDLALDKKYLGFEGDLSKSQVKKLREASFKYITETFYPALKEKFSEAGFNNVKVVLEDIKDADQDPVVIAIYYPEVIKSPGYVLPRVLVEIGSRSLREPFSLRRFSSLVGEKYPEQAFADKPIEIPTVNPERTFLEKLFLLHEEFQKPAERIRVDRLSRHLYDIEKLMDTSYAKTALADMKLYSEIVQHRKSISFVRGIDYTLHAPKTLNPLPPESILSEWEKDYKTMREEMIYGESLSFENLIKRMKTLTKKINELA